eukprot:TRINITY_DN47220_c0_g1_i1.p1 TRINITY_DN47220_c0_g1~~TRINITY_DN47220_c0_g1_i1.p1  ORF type:complete len:806 (-),score=134.60 TRINITY_DN47220_c0_g1_i1:49-2394(-)
MEDVSRDRLLEVDTKRSMKGEEEDSLARRSCRPQPTQVTAGAGDVAGCAAAVFRSAVPAAAQADTLSSPTAPRIPLPECSVTSRSDQMLDPLIASAELGQEQEPATAVAVAEVLQMPHREAHSDAVVATSVARTEEADGEAAEANDSKATASASAVKQVEQLVLDALRRRHPDISPDWPAITAAAYTDEVDSVEWLLESRADANALNPSQASPLWYAVGHVNVKATRLLLQALADPNHRRKNSKGEWRTLLEMAANNATPEGLLAELREAGAGCKAPLPWMRKGRQTASHHEGQSEESVGRLRGSLGSQSAGSADRADESTGFGSEALPSTWRIEGRLPAPVLAAASEQPEISTQPSFRGISGRSQTLAARRVFKRSYAKQSLELSGERPVLDFSAYKQAGGDSSGEEDAANCVSEDDQAERAPKHLFAGLTLPPRRGICAAAEKARFQLQRKWGIDAWQASLTSRPTILPPRPAPTTSSSERGFPMPPQAHRLPSTTMPSRVPRGSVALAAMSPKDKAADPLADPWGYSLASADNTTEQRSGMTGAFGSANSQARSQTRSEQEEQPSQKSALKRPAPPALPPPAHLLSAAKAARQASPTASNAGPEAWAAMSEVGHVEDELFDAKPTDWQWSEIKKLAAGAARHDPSRHGSAARTQAEKASLIDVRQLQFCHTTISPKFKNGRHRGMPVLSLLQDLHAGRSRAEDLAPLLVMKTDLGLEVICGNRRLYCLKRFAAESSLPVNAWCIVYDADADDTPTNLKVKRILSRTTDDGARIRVRDC